MDIITQTVGRVITKKERYFQNAVMGVSIIAAAALYFWTYYLISVYAIIIFFIALQILIYGFMYAAKNRQDFTYTVDRGMLTVTEIAMRKEKQIFSQSFENLVSFTDFEHVNKEIKQLKKEYDKVVFAAETTIPDGNSFLVFRKNGERTMLIISPNADIARCIQQSLGERPYDEEYYNGD